MLPARHDDDDMYVSMYISMHIFRHVYVCKYLDLARKLKKIWNMKVTAIPIVIGALGTVIKGSVPVRNHRLTMV